MSHVQTVEYLDALLRLSSMSVSASEDAIMTFALDESERLSRSKIGYFHLVNKDEKTINLCVWSGATRSHCAVGEKVTHYPVEVAGVWVDCIRERKTVIHNNYEALPRKGGLPEGHVPVVREMSVPLFDNNKIVAILGVGNKEVDYDKDDERVLTLFAQNAWNLIVHKRDFSELNTHRKNLEKLVASRTQKLEEKAAKLQEALDEIEVLRGILPICSYCKKIRNDSGYWQAVEEYFFKASNIEFSHGICPDCYDKVIRSLDSDVEEEPE